MHHLNSICTFCFALCLHNWGFLRLRKPHESGYDSWIVTALMSIAAYSISKGYRTYRRHHTSSFTDPHILSRIGSRLLCKGILDTVLKISCRSFLLDRCTGSVFHKVILPLSKPIVVYTVLTAFLITIARFRICKGYRWSKRQVLDSFSFSFTTCLRKSL